MDHLDWPITKNILDPNPKPKQNKEMTCFVFTLFYMDK